MNYIDLVLNPDKKREYTKLAFNTIIKDLYDNNKTGTDRMVDLVFYEDEKFFKGFVPGCFYIFHHESEILKNKDGKEFHDTIPLFLVMSVNQNIEGEDAFLFGINFNILTAPIRAAILQELNDLDSKFFENIFRERIKGKHSFSTVLISALKGKNGVKFLEYICQKYRINRESVAFRKYFIKNISKPRLIDYWQWKYLPFLNISEGIRGYQLKKLQYESINQNNNFEKRNI